MNADLVVGLTTLFLFASVWGVIWGIPCSIIAKSKNFSGPWFFWGFLFGIFALIVVCAKPAKRKAYRRRGEPAKSFDFLES